MLLNEMEAAIYLNTHHREHFTKKDELGKLQTRKVTQYDIKRWYGKGRIDKLTTKALDDAVRTNRIPPKRGRPARYTECDRESIIEACEHMPQGLVAQKFGCSPSYVSLVVRGLR